MKLKIVKPLWQTISLGAVAGMRTASAPAIASYILSRQNSGHLAKSSLAFMQSGKTANVFTVFAAGEFVTDKLPSTPNRTTPAGIAFRCISGALTGASIYKASGNNAFEGALLGAAAAFGATFGSYFLRTTIVSRLHVFDPLAGALEDALVIGAGVALVCADSA